MLTSQVSGNGTARFGDLQGTEKVDGAYGLSNQVIRGVSFAGGYG